MREGSESPLLAKSGPPVSLEQHIKDGLQIASRLEIAFPGLPVEDRHRFRELLRLCVIFHDLGKSHSEFRKVLQSLPHKWHLQRHELFSIPFVEQLPVPENERKMIALAVAGHHKDFGILDNFIKATYHIPSGQESEPEETELSFEKEFNEKVDAGVVLKLLETFDIAISRPVGRLPWKLISDYSRKKLCLHDKEYFDLLLLAGGLKHCDHLSSASLSEIPVIDTKDFAFLDRQRMKLQKEGHDFYLHQFICAQKNGNVILVSPTGSGKTESALLWLRNQLAINGQGRVFYVLPFTASINAMYERLNKDFGKPGTVGLLHGRIDAYLEQMVEEQPVSLSKEKRQETVKKLREEYKTLITPLKVVTPFQLLKHIFGLKGFEKGIFEWSGGYFILDEIHAYEPHVFAQIISLLRFVVRYLNVKVFIMTATLPAFMRKEIEDAIGTFDAVQATDELYKEFSRHKVVLAEGLLKDNFSLIRKELDKGKKVLVVCNTVRQAQEAYNELNADNKVLLHGSFNAFDRNRHEKRAQEKDVRLLVGTQAIEVSLNMDYDVIYTEPAPIDALIQRFGRVNRERMKGICECIVFKERNDADKYIYKDEAIVERTLRVLQSFGERVDEQQLQSAIDYVYPDWTEKGRQEYTTTYESLHRHIGRLSPFFMYPDSEEEFYKQFDGVKVLPASSKTAFQNYLKEFEFIKAESLKVQVSKSNYIRLLNERVIVKESFHFENKTGEKVQEIKYLLINRKYTPDRGLLINEEEDEDIKLAQLDDLIL